MIIKLQRPISQPTGPWLAYSEDRAWVFSLSPSLIPFDAQAAIGDAYKGYFEAEMVVGRLKIGRRVADQEW